jgi:hypothetical protein
MFHELAKSLLALGDVDRVCVRVISFLLPSLHNASHSFSLVSTMLRAHSEKDPNTREGLVFSNIRALLALRYCASVRLPLPAVGWSETPMLKGSGLVTR